MSDRRAQARQALTEHYQSLQGTHMRDLFDADVQRVDRFSLNKEDLLLDFSRNLMTEETWRLLLDLAAAWDVEAARDAMFAGELVNFTEQRPALHAALREPRGGSTELGGDIQRDRKYMFDYVEEVRSGDPTLPHGQFTDVVHIGIGGSALGVELTLAALSPWHDGPRVHVLSSVDPVAREQVLNSLNPKSTLVVVASKSFATDETIAVGCEALNWLRGGMGEEQVRDHIAAVTAAPADEAAEWGVGHERVFSFDRGVGGRYSIWSSVGLPVALAIGKRRFQDFLAGGGCMDVHFRTAPLAENLPVALGLVGVWNREFCGHASRVVVPYDHRLRRLPAYLQQLAMESNGKSTGADGAAVEWPTGPVVWGEPGTEAQHSFFQLLHQGTDPIPGEFLVAAHTLNPERQYAQDTLIANCLAQCEALMRGRTLAETEAALRAAGVEPEAAERLAPHKTFPGNRPVTLIAYRQLDPFMLGQILSLYEHRTLVEATLWNINPFDQMGVELGKELADSLHPAVRTGGGATEMPSSLAPTLAYFRSRARESGA